MQNAKILWVDDEIDLLKAHMMYLRERGMEVSSASNGIDGLELIKSENFDIVFLDEQMQGQRLLVMSNLKARPLRGFKSNGMVLCAAAVQPDGTEKVEFVEPPADAAVGEVVQFEGLPPPQPWAPNAVDKKKVLAAVAPDLVTSSDGTATWKGHVFMTSAGPCKAPTLFNAVMR